MSGVIRKSANGEGPEHPPVYRGRSWCRRSAARGSGRTRRPGGSSSSVPSPAGSPQWVRDSGGPVGRVESRRSSRSSATRCSGTRRFRNACWIWRSAVAPPTPCGRSTPLRSTVSRFRRGLHQRSPDGVRARSRRGGRRVSRAGPERSAGVGSPHRRRERHGEGR